MSYGLTTTPTDATEPVSVELLRQHLRLATNSEENLLSLYVQSARSLLEQWTLRLLRPSTCVLSLDSWNYWQDFYGYQFSTYNPPAFFYPNQFLQTVPLYLPAAPFTSLTSVQYYDASNVLQTFSDYSLDTAREPARLYPLSYPTLHTTRRPRLVITFVAGYTSATIPPQLRHATLLLASEFYRSREVYTTERLNELPVGLQAIVGQFSIRSLDEFGLR